MNDDEYELVKRRLQEDVREDVQKKLFRTYALVGLAVIGTLGYANWDFIEDTKNEVKTAAEDQVDAALEETLIKVDTLKAAVSHQTGRVDSEQDRVSDMLKDVAKQLSKLDVEASTLATLNETVSSLTESRRELQLGLSDVRGQTEQLSVLADELKRLASALQTNSSPANASQLQTVLDNVDSAIEKSKELADRSTVYLQFAGGARSRAIELSRLLTDEGFVLPGEERHAGAAGKKEVRYFHEEDLDAANTLASATVKSLEEMGYEHAGSVKLHDLTDFSGAKPVPGTLELWVEL